MDDHNTDANTDTAVQNWQHQHSFTQENNQGERNTLYVLILTVVTMVAEIIAGMIYGSMALLADGWHMGTHAAAFLITLFAYYYARKHKNSAKFAFGPSKVSVLAGFSSAIALLLVALIMIAESTLRLFSPQDIYFKEAIFVALIGLTVNVISVFLLKDHHSHDHHHAHCDDLHNNHHDEHHHDHNLRAAYFHVLADALTSILAIVALLLGMYFGLSFLDPVMGIVGALIISRWAWGLLTQTGPILLDKSIDPHYKQQIINCIESEPDQQISDIHIWKISADHFAAIISVVSVQPLTT
ncbi:CDF family Co(II)/Ni(II) efflux transporter DmeF, partial [Psychromonas hadalis]|uniref:CDF family Co(II)/Ni(II) efflux transporter DmeF n=1 Tax=Psychromonas hadalis TaxID=211669 RepID=UPI0003B4CB3B